MKQLNHSQNFYYHPNPEDGGRYCFQFVCLFTVGGGCLPWMRVVTHLGWRRGYPPWMGKGVPTLDGEGVPTLDVGEGVPTLDGGGGTYLGSGEEVPTLDRGGGT